MEMIDTRIYDDTFLLAKIFEHTELNKDEKERLYKHFEKRKKGRWIKHKDRDCWYCSECMADNYYAYSWNCDTKEDELQDHYCPTCGAEMRRGEEDEVD